MAGSYNSIVYAEQIIKSVYAEQIIKSRMIEDVPGAFAAQCDGLHVFGARVIKPKELVRITATQAAASSTI